MVSALPRAHLTALSFSSHTCLVGVGGPVPSDRVSPEAAGSVGRALCLSHWLLGEAGQRKGKDRR